MVILALIDERLKRLRNILDMLQKNLIPPVYYLLLFVLKLRIPYERRIKLSMDKDVR